MVVINHALLSSPFVSVNCLPDKSDSLPVYPLKRPRNARRNEKKTYKIRLPVRSFYVTVRFAAHDSIIGAIIELIDFHPLIPVNGAIKLRIQTYRNRADRTYQGLGTSRRSVGRFRAGQNVQVAPKAVGNRWAGTKDGCRCPNNGVDGMVQWVRRPRCKLGRKRRRSRALVHDTLAAGGGAFPNRRRVAAPARLANMLN